MTVDMEELREERTTCYRCRVCLAEHDTKDEALEHMHIHREPVTDEPKKKITVRRMAFKCQKCGEELNSQDEFLEHMVVNHNAHPKMYGTRKVYCPEVKNTPQERTIVTFSCSTCLEQFPTKEEMIEHSYANHPSNKLTFRCGNCEEGFESTDEV